MSSRPLLVGVHGWLLSRKVWRPLEQRWTAGDWSLWCPDLPGFGECSRPPGLRPTLASYGRWLAVQALERAKGAPIVLMGHSLGASVVLHAAHDLQKQKQNQCIGVICIAAGGGIYQPRPFQRLRQAGHWAVRLRPTLPINLGPFQADQRAAQGLLVNSTCRGAVREIPRLVSELAVPNLWISGRQDQVMEPGYVRHLAGYSPQHSLTIVEGCGHLPMQSHADALHDCLQGWLKDHIDLGRSLVKA